MDANQQQNDPSLVLAGQLLTRAAGRASEALDKFSGWMLAGFGAAFALVLANIQTVSKFVPVASLRGGALFLLVAIMVGVLQKYLASIVASAAAAGADGEALGQANADGVKFTVVFDQMELATLYPLRWAVKYAFRKAANGDVAVAGRMCFVVAQIQGGLVAVESVLALTAAAMVVGALAV
jgi:hypothetical protein